MMNQSNQTTQIDNQNQSPTLACRGCGKPMYARTLLSYKNMPASAQNFPTADTLSLDNGKDLDVCQCSACGLVQLMGQPVSYFKDVIRATAFSKEMGDFRATQFEQWVEKYQLANQPILEIGCGKGEYLSLLNAAGVNAHGLEHASSSVEHCMNLGLNVTQGYLGDTGTSSLNTMQFNGFVCLNFMEHWPNPTASLRHLIGHLTDGAIGLMEVPNFDMIIEKGLFSEFIADHLLYFTQTTLRTLLESNGFEVLECKPVWHDYILSAVVRKRRATNLKFFEQFKLDITSQLQQYISRFPNQKVAVWGAGHQSLAVIALADISAQLAYVIDSAPFKQGKYTPATHLPIVSPDQLPREPVDAIIVMAASYSDEVAQLIRAQYSKEIHLAILRDYGLEEI